jgi:hypothetical protein
MMAMSGQAPAPGEIDRKQFVGDRDVLAALGVIVEDLADPDVRSLVIRYEHPEFEDALKNRLDEIDVGDGPINPRLHLQVWGALHDEQPYDRKRQVAALRSLPGSGEQ